SAASLAEDLDRFQLGEPIRARPVGRIERFSKWIRRNVAVASLLFAVALALLAGTIVSTSFALIADHAATEARDSAKEAGDRAEEATQEREKARAEARKAMHNLYFANLQMAGTAWREGDVERLLELLDEAVTSGGDDFRGLEWHVLRHSQF